MRTGCTGRAGDFADRRSLEPPHHPSVADLHGPATTRITRLDLPVYFVHGVHDYTVSYALARSYFELLEAPAKGFYTFADSAHSPLFEEPARLREIMREDVLHGTTRLADEA